MLTLLVSRGRFNDVIAQVRFSSKFLFKREFLHQVGIEWADDLLSEMQRLWEYADGRVGGADDGPPGEDTNRSHCPVHPAWAVVQTAFTLELHLVRLESAAKSKTRAAMNNAKSISNGPLVSADKPKKISTPIINIPKMALAITSGSGCFVQFMRFIIFTSYGSEELVFCG